MIIGPHAGIGVGTIIERLPGGHILTSTDFEGLNIVTPPAVEPVTLSDMKLHLRVDITDDDNLISVLISAARAYVENNLRRALITQTWNLTMGHWPFDNQFCYPLPPLQSGAAVSYFDSSGTEWTLDPTTYRVDTASSPGRLVLGFGQRWPATTLRTSGAILAPFTCGYGADGTTVPAPIIAAIKLMVGNLYENREAVMVEQRALKVLEMPLAIDALLAPYRVLTFR